MEDIEELGEGADAHGKDGNVQISSGELNWKKQSLVGLAVHSGGHRVAICRGGCQNGAKVAFAGDGWMVSC